MKAGEEVCLWRDNYGRVGPELVVELKSGAVKIWHGGTIKSADIHRVRNAPTVSCELGSDSSETGTHKPGEDLSQNKSPDATISRACGLKPNRHYRTKSQSRADE